MKKHIIIFAAAITPLAFFSCSKEGITTQTKDNSPVSMPGEITKATVKSFADINSNLEALFQFNGDMKDSTGNLKDAIPSMPAAVQYTVDRRGVPNNAIRFGRYGIDIAKVPLKINMSVAAWVKYDVAPSSTNYFVAADWLAPDFVQDNNTYWGVISTPATSGVPSGSMDNQWHHLVATYDGKYLNFWVDGSFMGSTLNPYNGKPYAQNATVHYQVGYRTPPGSKIITSLWYGSIDDLRFYSRVLSDEDIKTLYVQ